MKNTIWGEESRQENQKSVLTVSKYEIVGPQAMLAIRSLGLWIQDLWVLGLDATLYSFYML